MRFYVLERSSIGSQNEKAFGTDARKAHGTRRGNAPRCPTCGNWIGMKEWLPPYRVELETWGREFGDLVFMGPPDVLVSERFKNLWAEEGLKGIESFDPVDIAAVKRHRKLTTAMPRYLRAKIQKSHTAIDTTASGFEWGKPPTCPECRIGNPLKRWKGVIIDESTWTGEDLYEARGLPGTLIASERTRELCTSAAITNVVFIPGESYAQDYYPWEEPPLFT